MARIWNQMPRTLAVIPWFFKCLKKSTMDSSRDLRAYYIWMQILYLKYFSEHFYIPSWKIYWYKICLIHIVTKFSLWFYFHAISEIFFMLHMTSGVVSLVVSAISAYITHNNSQQTVSVNKVKDVSTATTNEKRRFPNVRQRFRDTSFLNRAGFVVSLSLILAANLVMFNAKLKSSGCTQ